MRLCLSACRYDEQEGDTALILAAWRGHHECVSTLIANGADVNIIAPELEDWEFSIRDCSASALMMAADHGHHECLSILIANGANVHFASEVIARFPSSCTSLLRGS